MNDVTLVMTQDEAALLWDALQQFRDDTSDLIEEEEVDKDREELEDTLRQCNTLLDKLGRS